MERITFLELGRKIGESINIGDDIKFTILGIEGNRIKVGVDAPKELHIERVGPHDN